MTRSNIVALHFKGFSTRHISRTMNVSQPTVVRAIQRHKQTGNHSSRGRSGRPVGSVGRQHVRKMQKRPILKNRKSIQKWRRIPTEKRSGVVTLHKAGLSTRKIAAQLNLTQCSVFRIIKLFKETEPVFNRPYNSLNRQRRTATIQKLGNAVITPSRMRTATWKRVDNHKRAQILQMAAMGQSMRRIAAVTMINASTASRIIRSDVDKTSTVHLGRPRKQGTGSNPLKRTSSMTRSSFGSRRKESSIEQRAACMALYNEGLSTRLVAKRLCVSQSTVVRCVKRFKDTRSHENRK